MTDKPIIPVLEPEVVQAGARVWRGDDEKVPTTSISYLDHEGIRLQSRYGKAAEFQDMVGMVDAIQPNLRPLLISIMCDSKATHSYAVEAADGAPKIFLEMIGDQLEAACVKQHGGHNGIFITNRGEYLVGVDPNWDE